MVDSICIIEGIYYKNLQPLAYLRPVYDLRCGIFSFREKIERTYSEVPISLHCRQYMADYMELKYPRFKINKVEGKSCLFINGRAIVNENFRKKIPLDGPDKLYVNGGTVVAARASGKKFEELKKSLNDVFSYSDFEGLVKEEVDIPVINYPWDLINCNEEEIIRDFAILTDNKDSSQKANVHEGAYFINKADIFLDDNCEIYPTVVLDASDGPIFIGKNVKILPNATIQGPCYIGDNSIVKIGAKLYHNTNVGRVCKVGGEVENSIIHSFSNKQHDGFLGNSYLGSWVNLGAGTNNSDLKNNYGSIKVTINSEQIDSGNQFMGLVMGDHSKSAINTMFNTGSVIGISCNIYGHGFPPKYVPSFGWGGSEAMTTYDLERSLEVAQRVMARRNIEFTVPDERMFRKVFDLTREERRKRGMPN